MLAARTMAWKIHTMACCTALSSAAPPLMGPLRLSRLSSDGRRRSEGRRKLEVRRKLGPRRGAPWAAPPVSVVSPGAASWMLEAESTASSSPDFAASARSRVVAWLTCALTCRVNWRVSCRENWRTSVTACPAVLATPSANDDRRPTAVRPGSACDAATAAAATVAPPTMAVAADAPTGSVRFAGGEAPAAAWLTRGAPGEASPSTREATLLSFLEASRWGFGGPEGEAGTGLEAPAFPAMAPTAPPASFCLSACSSSAFSPKYLFIFVCGVIVVEG